MVREATAFLKSSENKIMEHTDVLNILHIKIGLKSQQVYGIINVNIKK